MLLFPTFGEPTRTTCRICLFERVTHRNTAGVCVSTYSLKISVQHGDRSQLLPHVKQLITEPTIPEPQLFNTGEADVHLLMRHTARQDQPVSYYTTLRAAVGSRSKIEHLFCLLSSPSILSCLSCLLDRRLNKIRTGSCIQSLASHSALLPPPKGAPEYVR